MATNNKKTNWQDRLKTADSAFVHDILQNFGLGGGLSIKDVPYLGLGAWAAGTLNEKRKERKERQQGEETTDDQRVHNFSEDMSKMRDIIDSRKTDRAPARNHPSNPGFTPETRSPYGFYDDEANGYIEGPPPSNPISNISEHPRFNSGDQGKSQRGRPFDREEE